VRWLLIGGLVVLLVGWLFHWIRRLREATRIDLRRDISLTKATVVVDLPQSGRAFDAG